MHTLTVVRQLPLRVLLLLAPPVFIAHFLEEGGDEAEEGEGGLELGLVGEDGSAGGGVVEALAGVQDAEGEAGEDSEAEIGERAILIGHGTPPLLWAHRRGCAMRVPW